MKILEDSDDLKLIMQELVSVARRSTCHRSKCGSVVIVNDKIIIGEGFNSMPNCEVAECFKDKLSPTFKSDKTCCVHAEQRAILKALKGKNSDMVDSSSSSIFFIRLDDNGNPKPSGKPYCSICSKMALDAGIKFFCLWHKEGWTAYDTKEYNELTFKYLE